MSADPPTVKYVTAAAGLEGDESLTDRCLIFTHIPKAAGTTLDRIIEAVARARGETYRRALGTYLGQWLGEEKEEAATWLKREILDRSDLAKLRYLTGHVAYGVHANLPLAGNYITILRDPIARSVSQFRMGVQRGAWGPDASVEALYADGRFIADPQTRQIAGADSPDVPSGEEQFSAATDNLADRYLLAATTDQFNEALKILIALFQWPDVVYGDFQVSQGNRNARLSDNQLAVMRQFNQLDERLYETVRTRPTIWNRDLVAGSPDIARQPSSRQDAVLVVRPHGQIRFMEQSLFRELEQQLINAGQRIAYY